MVLKPHIIGLVIISQRVMNWGVFGTASGRPRGAVGRYGKRKSQFIFAVDVSHVLKTIQIIEEVFDGIISILAVEQLQI